MDEHGPFIANLPIKDGDFPWFSIVVLVYWRVMLQIISDQHPHINPKNTSCLNLFSGEDRMGLCFSSVSKDLDFIFILSQWNIQPWPTFTQWKHWEYPPFRSISLESSRELVSFRGGTLFKSIQIDWGVIYYLTTMFFFHQLQPFSSFNISISDWLILTWWIHIFCWFVLCFITVFPLPFVDPQFHGRSKREPRRWQSSQTSTCRLLRVGHGE